MCCCAPDGHFSSACGFENTTYREGRSGYALSCCSPDATLGIGCGASLFLPGCGFQHVFYCFPLGSAVGSTKFWFTGMQSHGHAEPCSRELVDVVLNAIKVWVDVWPARIVVLVSLHARADLC